MVSCKAALLAILLSCIVSLVVSAREPPLYALYCADAPDAPPFYDSATVRLPGSSCSASCVLCTAGRHDPAIQYGRFETLGQQLYSVSCVIDAMWPCASNMLAVR